MIDRISRAILRCKPFALSIFLTYLLSSSAGIFLAHAGNRFALAQRDKTVQKALTSDKASIAYQSGDHATASSPLQHSSFSRRGMSRLRLAGVAEVGPNGRISRSA